MQRKQFRNQLKQIKKKWPSNIRPVLLPTGDIRIVRSFTHEDLLAYGIKSVKDLQGMQNTLEENIVAQDAEKVVQEFIELLKTTLNSGLSPHITIPLLEEFFPGIHDEILPL